MPHRVLMEGTTNLGTKLIERALLQGSVRSPRPQAGGASLKKHEL